MALSYAKLVYHVLDVIGDGSDPDRDPDSVPLPEGTQITINYPIDRIVDMTDLVPTTYYPKPIVCTVDNEGFLVDPQGARGVYIIDPTDESLDPHGYTLEVVIQIPGRGTKKMSAGLLVQNSEGAYDLTVNSPVPEYHGDATSAAQWAGAAAGSANAAANAAQEIEDFLTQMQNDGVVLPIGGTTGQALIKQSDTDYDADWEPLADVAHSGSYNDLNDQPDAAGVGAIPDPATKNPGDVPQWDGTDWVAAPAPSGGGGADLATVFLLMGA